jgi:hypothetical protein
MSNRNFDSRVIIQRLQNQVYARNLYSNVTSGLTTINNPQTSDGDSSRYNTYVSGAQTEYFRGLLGGGETISIGGIVNISPFLPTSTTVPAPAPPMPTVPSAPTITSITSGNTQLSVNFTAPVSNGGSPIINYEYSTDGGTTFIAFSPSDTTSPVVITTLSTNGSTPLTNGTAYPIVIRAVNSVGAGTSSNQVIGIPATTPTAPTITSITSGNTQLSVNFTAPSSDGGSSITNYQYSTDGGTTFIAFSPSDTTSPVVITTLSTNGSTPLTNGTAYPIVIRAVNSVGAGTSSNQVIGTPVTTPTAPTITSITSGNAQLSVNFTAPSSDGGSSITNYQYSTDDGSTFIAFSPSDTTSPVVITTLSTNGSTPLTNGTAYPIVIRAVNSVGTGTSSNQVIGIPATTPTAPTITSITPGNAQLSVNFTVPVSNGGSPIINYEYSTDDGTTFIAFSPSDTTSPVVITALSTNGSTPLTNGITYQVKLRAINTIGAGTASSTVSDTPFTFITSGLVLYYNFGDPASYPGFGTIVTDLSTSGFTGTLVNGPTFNSLNGGSIVFDGVNDYINTNNVVASNSFTINAWFKYSPGGSSIFKMLISNETSVDGNWNYRMLLRTDTGLLIGDIRNSSTPSSVTYTRNLADNIWHCVSFSRDLTSTLLKLYIDGILVNQQSGSAGPITNSQPVWIGLSALSGGSYPFNGNMGSDFIYNRALTDNEVYSNYLATKTRFGL